MSQPEKQTLKQKNYEQQEEPPLKEKDYVMTDSNPDSKISLSCWWSRGPSGQVQEWEARPTTTESTQRSELENRSSSSRWGTKSRNRRKSKT